MAIGQVAEASPSLTAHRWMRQVPAQQSQGTISGIVTDSTSGAPLANASVQVVGTDQVAVTDNAGRFLISNVPAGTQTVRVGLIGYQQVERQVEVTSGATVEANFTLAPAAVALEELVAVAYGTQRRGDLTSAVTAVGGEELAERPARNIQSALQGRAPGVTVWDQGGEPGAADMYFRIRGTTTLGNNAPLVIVDGIEQNWSYINPNEIESISILKDAASTAIYGSRGANGIVLITTKRGREGDFRVSYNTSFDFQNLATVPEHMGTEEYLRLQNIAYQNRGSEPPYSEEEIALYLSGEDRLRYPLPNTWFETVIQDNAPMQNHSLTVSGGTERLTSLVGLNYFDQQGIYPNRDAQRYSLRLNNDLRLNDRLSLGADLNVRRNLRRTTNFGSLYHRMMHGSQFAVPRFPDGTYGLSAQGHNPLLYSDPDYYGRTKWQIDYNVLNLTGDWEILPGLSLQSQFGIEAEKLSRLQNNPTFEVRDYWNPSVILKQNNVNTLEEQRQESLQTTWNTTLTWRTEFGDHGLTLLGGYSEIAFDGNNLTAGGRNFYNNDIRALGQSDPENRDLGSSYTDWGLRSFFGRLNYAYADRYLIEANMRYDGSSRFPPGDRYTFFPSLSLGWRVSDEPFWEPLSATINEFKPRVSWGRAGNQNVGLYSYFDRLAVGNDYVFNGTPVTGVRQNSMTSTDLTWETTTQTNIGLDAALFDNRLEVTFDWFDKTTEGILLNLPVPGVLGLNPAPTNAGSVKNVGWELALQHRGAWREVDYGVSLNVSDVKNEIVDLAGTGPYFSGEKNWFVRQEGYPIDALWGYRTDGYYTQEDLDAGYPTWAADAAPGDIKYVDLNEDGVIGPDDRTVLGSTQPRYTYGAALDLGWRNWDLNLHAQGVGKQDMAIMGAYVENGSWEGFALKIGEDYWTPEDPDARFPRPQKQTQKNTEPSDHWVIDASYFRLKNVQLGYTLPQSLTDRAGLRRMRLYVGGTNLFTRSDLTEWGTDAETVTGRTDYYQPVKTYTIGLNVDL